MDETLSRPPSTSPASPTASARPALAGAPASLRPAIVPDEVWAAARPSHRRALVRLTRAVRCAHAAVLALARQLADTQRQRLAEACGWEDVPALMEGLWGYQRRTTRRLIAVHETYVGQLRCARHDLADVHWTKLAVMLPVATPRTVRGWLAHARRTTLGVLRGEVRRLCTGGSRSPRVTKTFAIPPRAERVVELALAALGREAGTDDRGRQLELLAADALARRMDAEPGETRTVSATLSPEAYARLATALATTGGVSAAQALLALADHWLGCPWRRRATGPRRRSPR